LCCFLSFIPFFSYSSLFRSLYTKLYSLLVEKGWLLCIVGFLLGRAVVLSVVSPFALALLATLWLMQRDKTFKVMIATAAGAIITDRKSTHLNSSHVSSSYAV